MELIQFDPQGQSLEKILDQAKRKAIIELICHKPNLTLEQLQSCFAGQYGELLGSITIGELINSKIEFPKDGGPPIDYKILKLAIQSNGEKYDKFVYNVIVDANQAVSASYLRARVGGPRWKLQASLRRLVDKQQIIRTGITSSTRYRAFSKKS